MNHEITIGQREASSVFQRLQQFRAEAAADPIYAVAPVVESAEEAQERRAAGIAERLTQWHQFTRVDQPLLGNLTTDQFDEMIVAALRASLHANAVTWLSGSRGVGKSWVATAIGNSYAEAGKVPFFTTLNDFFTTAALYGVNRQDAKDAYYAAMRRADLLILDDWGASKPRWDEEGIAELDDIIDARRNHPRKRTLVTSNQSLPVRLKESEGQSISRVLDRFRGYVNTVEFIGPSRRGD